MVIVLGMVLVSGCGKSGGGGVADDYVSAMNKIAAAVEAVNDEASARQAAEVIAVVNKDMEKTIAALQQMSDSEKALILSLRAEDLQKVQMRIASAIQKLASEPQYLRAISDEMQHMPSLK